MERRRHTLGPWLTEANDYGDEIEVYPQKNGPPPIGRWAEICTVKDYESQEEMEANAALIAASPDLLAAAERLDAWWTEAHPAGPDGDTSHGLGNLSEDTIEIWRAFRAAIAKAEGRS